MLNLKICRIDAENMKLYGVKINATILISMHNTIKLKIYVPHDLESPLLEKLANMCTGDSYTKLETI